MAEAASESRRSPLWTWVIALFVLLVVYVLSADPVEMWCRKHGYSHNTYKRFKGDITRHDPERPYLIQVLYAPITWLSRSPKIQFYRDEYASWWWMHMP